MNTYNLINGRSHLLWALLCRGRSWAAKSGLTFTLLQFLCSIQLGKGLGMEKPASGLSLDAFLRLQTSLFGVSWAFHPWNSWDPSALCFLLSHICPQLNLARSWQIILAGGSFPLHPLTHPPAKPLAAPASLSFQDQFSCLTWPEFGVSIHPRSEFLCFHWGEKGRRGFLWLSWGWGSAELNECSGKPVNRKIMEWSGIYSTS